MRGRKPVLEKAMTAAERMRRYRLRKKQRAGVRPAGYQEYKARTLKQFAKLIEHVAKRDGYKIFEITAILKIEENEWRAIRSGQKGRIYRARYEDMFEIAKSRGWIQMELKKTGNLTIFERPLRLLDKRRWDRAIEFPPLTRLLERAKARREAADAKLGSCP